MNKSKFIWGIICLVVAVVLAVLYFALPADSMAFHVGDRNLPWIPSVVLAIVGIVLLYSARQPQAELPAPEQTAAPTPGKDPEKAALNKRLETMAWGCFLIVVGGLALLPEGSMPKGISSILVGLIMLGLNVARYFNKLKMSGFTTFLGIVAIIGGVLELVGVKGIEGAVLIIVLGAYLILKPMLDKRQLFGKAEES